MLWVHTPLNLFLQWRKPRLREKQVTWSVSQSKEVKEVGFEPKSAGLQSPTLLHKGPNNAPVWWTPTTYEALQLRLCLLSKMFLCDAQFYLLFSEKEIRSGRSTLRSRGHRATGWRIQGLNCVHLRQGAHSIPAWPDAVKWGHCGRNWGEERARPWLWVQQGFKGVPKPQTLRAILFFFLCVCVSHTLFFLKTKAMGKKKQLWWADYQNCKSRQDMTGLGVGKGELQSARHMQSQVLSLFEVLTFYSSRIFFQFSFKIEVKFTWHKINHLKWHLCYYLHLYYIFTFINITIYCIM